MSSVQNLPSESKTANADGPVDEREQLFNEGKTGQITEIQVSTERITKLRGVLFDLDPKNYRTSSLLPEAPQDPHEFYSTVAGPWLRRNDVLARAEVRVTGTGLHAILWFDEPVIITSDDDRDRWTGIVKVVQAVMPIDPDQPHITALTRPVGSINSKNGATVRVLHQGEPVSQEDVVGLCEEMLAAPFATVLNILAGSTKLEPCPVCNKEGSRLSGLNWTGQCYGSCGDVKLEKLYDVVFSPRNGTGTEVAADDTKSK